MKISALRTSTRGGGEKGGGLPSTKRAGKKGGDPATQKQKEETDVIEGPRRMARILPSEMAGKKGNQKEYLHSRDRRVQGKETRSQRKKGEQEKKKT